MNRSLRNGMLLLIALAFGAMPRTVHACATCFGDPESNIAKGAMSGVIVLAIVVYGMLMCMVGTTFLWWRRSRRIAATEPVSDHAQQRQPSEQG